MLGLLSRIGKEKQMIISQSREALACLTWDEYGNSTARQLRAISEFVKASSK